MLNYTHFSIWFGMFVFKVHYSECNNTDVITKRLLRKYRTILQNVFV